MTNSFWQFIEEKPLYYKEIDHERVHKAYALLKAKIKQPMTIHIVGTNGKGSTGRIMASLLHFSGTKVGYFSSPHILKFNERIWIEGEDVSDEVLEKAHEKLYVILGKVMSDALSYFEYTTLLALVIMENLEVIILEAGLGGEFDATNVCSKVLSIITPIGLDHQDFLGNSINEIAQTKMNAIDKQFVLSLQVHDEVYTIAQKIVKEKKATVFDVSNTKLIEASERKALEQEITKVAWSEYLLENTLAVITALKVLNLKYDIQNISKIKLFGRFYQFRKNIIVDVGHNLLATKAITKALQAKKIKPILIYNTLDDKDYVSILKEFQPHIKGVEIIEIDSPRALEKKLLEEALMQVQISYDDFNKIEEAQSYLVFGSFYVLESFLNKINNNLI